jgi:hypothetical protein
LTWEQNFLRSLGTPKPSEGGCFESLAVASHPLQPDSILPARKGSTRHRIFRKLGAKTEANI